MKKNLILSFCLLGTFFTASAQFKIHSNGNLSFKRTAASLPRSPISLGNAGTAASDSNYFVAYRGDKNGVYINLTEVPGVSGKSCGANILCASGGLSASIGLKAHSSIQYDPSQTGNLGAIGVWGDCFSYWTGRYSYGVLGTVDAIDNYAAVCGIASFVDFSAAIPDDRYAGLFVGKTKISGNLDVTGTVNGVVISPSERGATDVRCMGSETLTEKIQSLSTHSFRYPERVSGYSQRPVFLEPDEEKVEEMKRMGIDPSKAAEENPDMLTEQLQAKQHYAIPANELEEVFPDLVYTDKDGGKHVNYVEMVPLLVQCINELNARLSALDGNVGAGPVPARDDMAAVRASQNDVSDIDGTVSKTKATLYQNTPNPFAAQTEIRFSLPDDAPQAYIYIFDMTGKMQKQIPVSPDQQSVTINGYELSAGIYLYSLVVGGQEIDTKRMILSK